MLLLCGVDMIAKLKYIKKNFSSSHPVIIKLREFSFWTLRKKKIWQSLFSPDAIYRALSNWIGIERHDHFYLTVIQKMCAYFWLKIPKMDFTYISFFFFSHLHLSLCLGHIFWIKCENVKITSRHAINYIWKKKKTTTTTTTTSDKWFKEFTMN